jgi:hypothetical protein
MRQRDEHERAPTQARRSGCPQCGSSNVLKIAYGYPADLSPEGMEGARRDGITFGGCCIPGEGTTRECGDCGSRWGGVFGRQVAPKRFVEG